MASQRIGSPGSQKAGVRETYAALMARLTKERAQDRIAELATRGHDLVTFWRECTEVLERAVAHYDGPAGTRSTRPRF